MVNADFEKASNLLQAAQRVIIVTHLNPDGDAFGSMLGLGHALASLGKSVVCAVDGGITERFRFLPGSESVLPSLAGIAADLVFVVDCSDERRAGVVGQQARALGVPMVNLDHHRTNDGFGDANLVDAAWVSASEGVFDWLMALGVKIATQAAQCLLCGLVTDTQAFRTSNVGASTLAKAQQLIDAGGNLGQIVRRTVNNTPTAVIRLWGQVMPTVQLEDHVIWAKISSAAFEAAGVIDSNDGGLVSLLLQADDAYISCVLTEERGGIDASLRAKPGFDVAKVATDLGGGGHLLASGAWMAGAMDEVEARVIPLLKAAVAAGNLMP